MHENYINDDIIGIDLGTTNTCVAIWRNGNVEIIADEHGNRTIPSYVAFSNKSVYVGHEAKNQKDINIKNVFYDIKKLIGMHYVDIKECEKKLFSYSIIDHNGNVAVKSDLKKERIMMPEEISAVILNKVRMIASKYLNKDITKCVITVPANFNDGQRQATRDAATIAGLDCIRIINEPTAAALAHGLLERSQSCTSEIKTKTVLVYDLGGGTLDVSLLKIENGIFEVIDIKGNTRIGGSNFDNRLIEYCIKKFEKKHNIKISELSCLSLQQLRFACEEARKRLSTVIETVIIVNDFYDSNDLIYKLSRIEFEEMCADLFYVCLKFINDILKDNALNANEINEVILVGGMTKTLKIRELLSLIFKTNINFTVNPDEIVAVGAAIQGYLLSHPSNPFSESVTLLDAVSLSLGIETIGGVMDTIIQRGSILPSIESKLYTTFDDYVDGVKIKVFEGERKLTKNNFFVGEFELNFESKQQRGMPEIEVEFRIDINGIITVTANNTKSDNSTNIIVTSHKGRLTKDKIIELIEEAKDFEFQDDFEFKKKNKYIEIKDICYNILTNIRSNDVVLQNKETIKSEIENLLKKINENDYGDNNVICEKLYEKYGIIAIKNIKNDIEVQMTQSNENTTLIYDDDENNDDCENIKTLSDDENAIKQMKKLIIDFCNSLFVMISNKNINMSQKHIDELKEYVDETMLWTYVSREKIDAYNDKLTEMNDNCNAMFDNYVNVDLIKIDKIDELKTACLTLHLMIVDNIFIIENQNNIITQIENIIDDVEKINDEKCDEYMKFINELFDKLSNEHKNKIKFEINTPCGNNEMIDTQDNLSCGTSIISIIQNKQQTRINKMIND